jgi:hypothetical protein
MALSNAERQRRYRQNLHMKARQADIPGHADIAAVYELLRKQWLLLEGGDNECGPSEQAYREKLAAMPVGMRPASEAPERIFDTLLWAVGGILDKTYRAKILGKARIDRKAAAGNPGRAPEDLSAVTTRAGGG